MEGINEFISKGKAEMAEHGRPTRAQTSGKSRNLLCVAATAICMGNKMPVQVFNLQKRQHQTRRMRRRHRHDDLLI